MHRSTGILDGIATAAIVVATGVLTYVAFVDSTTRTGDARRWQQTPYEIGENLVEGLPTIDFQAAAQTVIVAIKSSCRYCTESMPFYRKLVISSGTRPVVFVGLEGETTLRAYLERHGISGQRVVSVDPRKFKLAGTPTLLVANSTGSVVSVKQGRLASEAEEEQWLKEIVSGSTNRGE